VNNLLARFRKKFGSSYLADYVMGTNGSMYLGFQTVRPTDRYVWDGLRRGGEADNPHWLFQMTLLGRGFFTTAKSKKTVDAGRSFCAVIPSTHVYQSDPTCARWTFFYVIVRHPYVVSRLLRHPKLVNSVADWSENTSALERVVQMFFQLSEADDEWTTEEALLQWMLALERTAFSTRHPLEERTRLSRQLEKYVLSHLDSYIPVTEVAGAIGMSRSNFSHHFRKITGQTPASMILKIRLREAGRLLTHRNLSIKEVAAKTGFADTNHLCKCFRAHLEISPGAYRRLRGVGPMEWSYAKVGRRRLKAKNSLE
jgi:AraC-like DNA-binding protein